MNNRINNINVVGALLILSGFGVVFAYGHNAYAAQVVNHQSTITNDISVTSSTHNNEANGIDGADGTDGHDGAEGADGSDGSNGSAVSHTGDAQASVKVVNIVDGKEVDTSTIDIQTSTSNKADINKQQVIISNDGTTVLQNTVNVETSTSKSSAANDDDDFSSAIVIDTDLQGETESEVIKTHAQDKTNPFIGVLVAVVTSVVNFFSSIFNIF